MTYVYHSRSNREFSMENVKIVHYVTESLLFVSAKLLWEPILLDLSYHTLEQF